VTAGQTAVTTSEPLRRFLDGYPPPPLSAAPREAHTHAAR
jgi:hypothetical protein